MTAQELAQQILDRIKEADKRFAESDPDSFWHFHYTLVIDGIERLCEEQLKEPVKP